MQGKKPLPSRFKKSFVAVAVMLGVSGGATVGGTAFEYKQAQRRAADNAAQSAPAPVAPALEQSFNSAANGNEVSNVCDISEETALICSQNDNGEPIDVSTPPPGP